MSLDFKCPVEWLEQETAWPVLMREFSPRLKQLVGDDGRLDRAEGEFKSWESFVLYNSKRSPAILHQWEMAQRRFSCARVAHNPVQVQNEVDYVGFVQSLPEQLKAHAGWAIDCIRLLSQRPLSGSQVRTVRRSVVLSDNHSSKGSLATLVMDFLEPGAGQVFQHPEFCLHTFADPAFTESFENAFHAARALNVRDGQLPFCDLRWRLVGMDGGDISEVEGPSASGEVALAACLTLRGQVPDEHLIVVAQCNADGTLVPVGGLREKVLAIVTSDKFDTIIVATEQAKLDAESALPKESNLRIIACESPSN
jgi:hypothetical protein